MAEDVELEDLSVVFEELLGWLNLSSSFFVLDVVFHGVIFDGDVFDLGLGKWVLFDSFVLALGVSDIFVELTGVLVAVIDVNIFSEDFDVLSDLEIEYSEMLAGSVGSQDLLSFQEGSLGDSGVNNFGFINLDWVIFQVEIDDDFSDSVGFQGSFNAGFFEVSVESEGLGMIWGYLGGRLWLFIY